MVSVEAIRLFILRQLMKRPVNVYWLYKHSSYTTFQLEDELRLLIKEHIVFARDRKFFIRNLTYAMQFVNVDRRFSNGSAQKA